MGRRDVDGADAAYGRTKREVPLLEAPAIAKGDDFGKDAKDGKRRGKGEKVCEVKDEVEVLLKGWGMQDR